MKSTYPPESFAPHEAVGLIPKNIFLQAELNEWEQLNILEAETWAFGKKHKDLLTIGFIQKLHKKMFGQTWRQAGHFRQTAKDLGVEPHQIYVELLKFCGDAQIQQKYKSYPLDEIAARLHHRLAWIQPFLNGNGRYARLYADIFLVANGKERFSWGKGTLSSPANIRHTYMATLREADKFNFTPLLEFVRS